MEKSEIIAGLKDLIHDRESFITPENDKFYGEENPFRHDKAVLQAAIDELTRRTAPENKPLTLEQLRQMEGQPIWVEQKDTYYKCGWALVTSGKDIIASNGECNFEKANYGKTWLAYARKPGGSEKV